MKKKIVLALIIIIVVLLIVRPSSQQTQSVSAEHIKIGLLTSFTGSFAVAGPEFQKGIELALDDLSLNGNKPNIDVAYEDDQSLNPTVSASAAQKLLNTDKIDIGLVPSDIMAKIVGPIFSDKKVPLLVFWDANREVDTMGPYVFSSGYVTELAGARMANHATKKLGLKTAYIISSNDEWGKVISSSFKEAFESQEGKIVGADEINPGLTDFRTILTKIRAINPDAIYFPISSPASLTAIVKQIKNLNIQSTLLTGDWLLPPVISDLGASSNSIYFTNVYTPNSAVLSQKYKAKYGKDPIVVDWVSFTYDAVQLIAKANTQASAQGKKITEVLPGTSIEGMGGYVIIGNKSIQNNRAESVFKIVNGVPTLIPQ